MLTVYRSHFNKEVFQRVEVAALHEAKHTWPRNFKEGHISWFYFPNYYIFPKDIIYQGHWICWNKLNMDSIAMDTINIEWIKINAVLKVAEGWILSREGNKEQ